MRALLFRLFNRLRCETCEALRGQIQDLKEERVFLHNQIEVLQQALFRAVRLSAIAERSHSERTADPMATMPPLWTSMKAKLEAKHRRKDGVPPPEDKVKEHWEGKIAEMESKVNAS